VKLFARVPSIQGVGGFTPAQNGKMADPFAKFKPISWVEIGLMEMTHNIL